MSPGLLRLCYCCDFWLRNFYATSPPTSLGERSSGAFSDAGVRGLTEQANGDDIAVCTGLLSDSAVAPSPEQRLKGVLDLSPDFVGGEVTAVFLAAYAPRLLAVATPWLKNALQHFAVH